MNKDSSICLQITTKCNFLCNHCYLSCGPFRNEVMSKEVIKEALYKVGIKSKRVWISGGEPTLYPELIKYIIELCKKCREEFGYPKEICLQTNGSWAISEEQAVMKMQYFKEIGITDLDLSGFDEFHKEFHKGFSMLELGTLANKLKFFNSVTISGSSEVDLKYLGRSKNLDKLKVFKNDCVLAANQYNINVHGDIQVCKWGHTCYLGSILENDIEQVLNYEFIKILMQEGITGLIKEYNEKFNKTLEFDGSKDVCELCHHITSEWKRNI